MLFDLSPCWLAHIWAMPSAGVMSPPAGFPRSWNALCAQLPTLHLSLSSGSLSLMTPMDSNQKLIEKLVQRQMQNTGKSQEVVTATVLAAFEKLIKGKVE